MNNIFIIDRRRTLQALLCAASLLATSAHAQGGYPNRPITWVVPYAAGAATDTLTRYLAKDMSIDLGKPIAVDNMPGAGTVKAAVQMADAKPDGYRIMSADSATLALNPALMEKLPYNAQKSFTLIGMFARFPLVLVVHKDVPVKTTSELIEYVRKRPGQTNYASAGLGTPHHLAMELFLDKTSTKMTHVPYNGSGPALTDLLAGRVNVMFSSLSSIAPYLQNGNLRAIAVTGTERFPTLASVPTMAESDPLLNGYELYAWQGLVAPAGLPADIRSRLSDSLQKIVSSETVKKRFLDLGIEAISGTPASFEQYAQNEATRWTALVKSRGIQRE